MMLTTRIAFLLLAVGSCAAAEDKNVEQEEAIAAIQKMKGRVVLDTQRPGKPVVQVHLYAGKTAGIGLAPLAKLPEIEWIGLHLSDITEADLEHLKGLKKLRRLGLADIKLSDDGLKRIEDMTSLEILYLMENPITDAGLDHLLKLTKLKELGIGQTKITDAGLERLKNFPDLQTLQLQQLKITDSGVKHLQVLTKLQALDLTHCNQVRDLTPLHGLLLTSLSLTYCSQIQDISPLAGMPLTTLNVFGCRPLRDLSPLKGMPLTTLDIGATQVADLSPLLGMKLAILHCHQTPVADLTPLKGAPLTLLNLRDCKQLHDLTPLAEMSLSELHFTPQNFDKDSLEVLRKIASLKTIVAGNKATDRLTAENFWKKFDAGEFSP